MTKPEKIDIAPRYPAEIEIRVDSRPYEAYAQMLGSVFDLSKLESFCDVGCANGHLLSALQRSCQKSTRLKGYEFFQYQKDSAPSNVKDLIEIVDLRDPLPACESYDIVNCTEVGEHIDPAFASVLLENLKKLTKRFLIMSWSETGGVNDHQNDPRHQHLNPLTTRQFQQLMIDSGFLLQEEATHHLLMASNIPYFHDWWRKSLSVWKVNK